MEERPRHVFRFTTTLSAVLAVMFGNLLRNPIVEEAR